MTAKEVVQRILKSRHGNMQNPLGIGFAPTNIALIKYWGKRDAQINLPQASSLSIALPEKGAFTTIQPITDRKDRFFLNGKLVSHHEYFAKRLIQFLDLFRPTSKMHFLIETQMNIPVSAGVASSACGFAALTLALDDLFNWQLDRQSLSLLARLGSGSACRSLWPGFVKWHVGHRDDGMDSYAEPLSAQWPELRIGLLCVNDKVKKISSRQAMQQTVATSPYYPLWQQNTLNELKTLETAIFKQDFLTLGEIAEKNALGMHASMLTAWPPIFYWQAKSLNIIHKVWQLRAEGLPLFFTQDAGPNIKLLFLASVTSQVQAEFPDIDLLTPFPMNDTNTKVILVDKKDRAIGHADKMTAHQQGLCHRAFSIFIFRKNQGQLEVLLQRRHPNKYHCGNLWTNTCCSHPQPGESMMEAAQHRLKEEMDIVTPLFQSGSFHYTATFSNGLSENEVDHVLTGFADPSSIQPDPKEVADHQWLSIATLRKELSTNPQIFTPWLARALEIALKQIK